MKYFIRSWGLWVPALVGVLFLALFSSLRSASHAEDIRSVSAVSSNSSTELSDANLVDDLSALPLGLKIGQADWNKGSLYLDMRITEETLSIESIYRELATILSFTFEEKENVNRLFLRFEAVDPWSQARYLVLAANVRRDEWDNTLLDELKQMKKEPVSERLVQGLHLTLTNLWKKQFIN